MGSLRTLLFSLCLQSDELRLNVSTTCGTCVHQYLRTFEDNELTPRVEPLERGRSYADHFPLPNEKRFPF